ncbi:MAG: hypothetical protein L6R35_003994 [Caloplaca aegaea]|nr:MAG: hypothetical protein L6R35_003994 [Caloplaca aegaea]
MDYQAPSDKMETQHKAIVTLTPRDDESDFTRVITLVYPSESVIIGRASKTASKGLVGLPENAWFNSPIMSREHAKLFMTSDGAVSPLATYDQILYLTEWHQVHIQDFASTHGTFVGQQRLTPNKPAPLSNGDVIKFGTTVTSGPVTYYGRAFDIHLSLVIDSPQISPSSSTSKASERSGFHVPNNDADSVSDVSDAESCLLVKSHPRTFSVPSSSDEDEATDDEDIVISASRRTSLTQKCSLPPVSKHPGPHKLSNGQGQQTASHDQAGSQKDPIALQSPPMADDGYNDSSNDEELDSIVDGHGQRPPPTVENPADASMSIDEIPDTYQSPSWMVESQNHRIGKDRQENESRHRDENNTMDPASGYMAYEPEVDRASRPSSAPGPYDPQTAQESCSHTKSDREYVSSNPEDDLGDVDNDANNQAVVGESPMSQTTAGLSGPPFFTSVSRLALSNHNSLQDPVDYPSYFGWSMAGASECSIPQPQSTTYKICQPLSARWHCASNKVRAPSPSDAALVRKASAGLEESNNPFFAADHNGEPPGPYTYMRYGFPWASHLGHPLGEPLTTTTVRHTVPSVPSPTTDDWQAMQANNLERVRSELGDYHQGPFSRDYESFHSAADTPSSMGVRSTSTPPQKQCIVKLKLDVDSTHPHGDEAGDERLAAFSDPKLDLAKSSKVDISNLVNPHTDKSRSLKRKSDQISSDEEASDVRISSPPPPIQAAYEFQAEPRTTMDAPVSIREQDLGIAQLKRSSGLGEPARKKRKRSMVKASTIGGLVSGICLGLAGAFAAFIAAIPAEVRDEALRETTKLT